MGTSEVIIIAVLVIVFSVLYIRLLKRIWKMTEDVHEITSMLKKIIEEKNQEND